MRRSWRVCRDGDIDKTPAEGGIMRDQMRLAHFKAIEDDRFGDLDGNGDAGENAETLPPVPVESGVGGVDRCLLVLQR